MTSRWIRFAQQGIRDGRYVVGIETQERQDEIYFTVPPDFFVHNDSVAAALATLCGKSYGSIRFHFSVSSACCNAIAKRSGADVSALVNGPRRVPGNYFALNFSGGFDSLVSHLLAPEQIRVAVAFGSWFEREREFFETLAPEIICTTDFRQKGYERNDWLFMFAASLLYADYLDLGGIALGTTFEATSWNYRFTNNKSFAPVPLFEALGLRDTTFTRGLTAWGNAHLMLHYAPDKIDPSILSLAPAKSEKRLRRRLMVDEARHRNGGPPPDFDSYEFPDIKLEWARGDAYGTDLQYLIFLRLYGREIVSRWVDGLDQVDFDALNNLDVSWIFRYNPLFLEEVPPEFKLGVLERLQAAGITPFLDADWPNYRALRELLPKVYRFPNEVPGPLREQVRACSAD